MACSTALAVNASLDHPQVWLLYVLGATMSAIFAARYPVHRSLVPLLLTNDLRPAGYALQATLGSLGMMAGPALAGVLISGLGLTSAYGLDVVTYVVALLAYAGLAPSPPFAGAGRASRDSVVAGTAVPARALGDPQRLRRRPARHGVRHAPARCSRRWPSGWAAAPTMYGLLLSSVAAGAFVASIVSGWTIRIKHSGRAVLYSVVAWGAAITVVGLTREPAVVLAMLAVRGRRRHDLRRLPLDDRGRGHA